MYFPRMVRPDEDDDSRSSEKTFSGRAFPAGESPASVIAGEPSSRPQATIERSLSRAGCRQPGERDREQSDGPQRVVKVEQASSEHHPKGARESRAGHATAKATDSALVPERAVDLSGVMAAARREGDKRNRRDPPRQLTSSKVGHISAERESVRCREGVRGGRSTDEVVDNTMEGRTSASIERADAGKREGVAARSKDPVDKVRRLQRKLWVSAKQSETRRFHALYDRIYRRDVLQRAWERVRENRGAAGVDAESIEAIERNGVEGWLDVIEAELRAGEYRPSPVLRRYIPKSDGKSRPLGIPTLKDRVVQTAAKLVIEPIFEADFLPCSHGFRPKRGATGALETIRKGANRGLNFVVDADIRSFFDNIDQPTLIGLVEKRISDRRVVKLIRKWLEAGVMEDGTIRETLAGTPQGGVISPLLANIYLHALDRYWQTKCGHLGELVRYADDFVVMCKREPAAKEALQRVRAKLAELKLELHPDKTRIVDVGRGRGSFDFLGCTFRKKRSILRAPHLSFMQRWPSPRAMKRIRDRVHDLTDSRRSGARDVTEIISSLNPVLLGWANYFRTGNADLKFNQVDDYVHGRIVRWLWRRGGQRARFAPWKWPHDRLFAMGLHRLRKRVRYPAKASPVRSSVSRVRENCTHGLKGGLARMTVIERKGK